MKKRGAGVNVRNTREYMEKFLYIRTKDSRVIPLRLNPAQEKMYDALRYQHNSGQPMRVIILKARQLGFSTLAEALIFQRTATRENVNSLIVAHREDSAANLFKMSKLFFEKLPPELRPMVKNSNARELVFENPERDPERKARSPGLMSRIRCVPAGGDGIGRSDTLHNVHASEFAFWKGDKAATWVGIMQAVPAEPGTLVIVESTANGFDEFRRMWEAAVRGESDFLPLFFAWYENPGYRMSAEPGAVWTEEERELGERFGLDGEQLQWRRWCIKNNCAGDERLFRQEYPSTPEEAFLTSGAGVFDNEAVMARMEDCRGAAPQRGFFEYDQDGENPLKITNIRFRQSERGVIAIYEQPRKRRPYVLGGDTAGTGSDYFTGQVVDNVTGCQAAVLRQQYDEDLYAKQLYCLGLYYNTALIGVETNYSTYPVKLLSLMGYPRLYVRELPDTYMGGLREAFGFETNMRTRPVIIAALVALFREEPGCVRDAATLGEMLTFAYNEARRPEALPGEHDDLVMALAIAHAIRSQQSRADEPEPGRRGIWTRDMLEDYRNAGEDDRARMVRAWGNFM